MPRGRPLAPLHVTDQAKEQLKRMANSRTLPHALVRRAQIILMCAEGLMNMRIAEKVGLSGSMVGMWRKRFIHQGIMGLYDEPRAGGPRSISDEQVAQMIQQTLKQRPPQCHSLELSLDCPKDQSVEVNRAENLAHVRYPAPSPKALHPIHRPFLLRKSSRYCRLVFEPSRQGPGVVR